VADAITVSIANAIIKMENDNPSLNNPGAIMDLSYYHSTGQFQLQQYPTYQDGLTALYNLIDSYRSQGMTLSQFFAKYAPASAGNDPTNYANFVAAQTGLPVNSVIPAPGTADTVNAVSAAADAAAVTPTGNAVTSSFADGVDATDYPNAGDLTNSSIWTWLAIGAGAVALWWLVD